MLLKKCFLSFVQALLNILIGIKNDSLLILADPALDWKIEILFAYPGFWALFWYRIAHFLFEWRCPYLPRFIMGAVRFMTAIDIHPGAKISTGGVFIDHGTGVVIGATSEIGPGTTIYHEVTLGASGKPVPKGERRHPIVGRNCVLGAGTRVIGAIRVGDGVITGANCVVTKSVELNCIAVGVPARSRPKVLVANQERTAGKAKKAPTLGRNPFEIRGEIPTQQNHKPSPRRRNSCSEGLGHTQQAQCPRRRNSCASEAVQQILSHPPRRMSISEIRQIHPLFQQQQKDSVNDTVVVANEDNENYYGIISK